jgi:hypothetical protein
MGLSNLVAGKRNSIEQSGGGVDRGTERAAHAPMFALPGEPEPNAVCGERLQPGQSRPRRQATRTLAEAREIGLAHAEALDLTREEIEGWAGMPPHSPQDGPEGPG